MGDSFEAAQEMIATLMQASVCGVAIYAALADARMHRIGITPLSRRIATMSLGAIAALMGAAVVASWAPIVTGVHHRIIGAMPGTVVFEWSGTKPRWTEPCERSGVAVFLIDASGNKYAAQSIEYSASTGDVTRPSGAQSFGVWTVRYRKDIDALSIAVRSVHHCPFSIRANVTDVGPWPIQVAK